MKNIMHGVKVILLVYSFQCLSVNFSDACAGCRILTPLIRNDASAARKLSQIPSHHFLGLESHAGFLTVKEKYGSNLFFWFFPAKKPLETTPWIIWLQGVKYRKANLAQDYSVLFLDNPVGAGFSFTNHEDGYTNNEDDVGEQMLEFLQQFLQMFPELRSAPLFLAGESYAGKYIPALGIQIHRYTTKNYKSEYGVSQTGEKSSINLRGLLIGGGMINPGMMMKYSSLVSALGLLDADKNAELAYLESAVVKLLDEGRMVDAANTFNETIDYIKKHTSVSVYNFVEDPSSVNKAPEFEGFITRPEIRELLGAGNVTFDLNNQKVYEKMLPDIMNSTQPFLEELLEHYPVLCYHGQQDIIMAYSLAMNTYNSLQWSGRAEYINATRSTLTDLKNRTLGYTKSGGGFTEMLIRHAGHMVAGDVPEVATYIHYKFIEDNKE